MFCIDTPMSAYWSAPATKPDLKPPCKFKGNCNWREESSLVLRSRRNPRTISCICTTRLRIRSDSHSRQRHRYFWMHITLWCAKAIRTMKITKTRSPICPTRSLLVWTGHGKANPNTSHESCTWRGFPFIMHASCQYPLASAIELTGRNVIGKPHPFWRHHVNLAENQSECYSDK